MPRTCKARAESNFFEFFLTFTVSETLGLTKKSWFRMESAPGILLRQHHVATGTGVLQDTNEFRATGRTQWSITRPLRNWRPFDRRAIAVCRLRAGPWRSLRAFLNRRESRLLPGGAGSAGTVGAKRRAGYSERPKQGLHAAVISSLPSARPPSPSRSDKRLLALEGADILPTT